MVVKYQEGKRKMRERQMENGEKEMENKREQRSREGEKEQRRRKKGKGSREREKIKGGREGKRGYKGTENEEWMERLQNRVASRIEVNIYLEIDTEIPNKKITSLMYK